ncbi:RagB/SusD family nutrient uptake outer membrane protein [Psychroflexus aestuariivivens]|uniref:RagB/SusD family nutrient uptake outer membrane protein n=1 Tax=Psychroflexus aestuariivivens TaxID=1795040 RepID=UPI000FDA3B30|nr:RagB/SusD family nutrient uptake outer membrane protein [Psychroflexus aestuariivivens]
MKIKNLLIIFPLLAIIFLTSCEDDLDTEVRDPNIVLDEEVFDGPESYKQALAGVYANLALSSLTDPGASNIGGLDPGTGQYMRGLFNLQNLSTDEAIFTFENDPGIRGLQRNTWSPDNPLILGAFARPMFQVSLSNEFLRQTSETALNSRGVQGELKDDIQVYRAEVRTLRALAYYHLMDLFGKAPFYDETTEPGFTQGPEYNREQLFEFIESELNEVLDQLPEANTNEYARVDQGVANMILAKIYLNAEVYINQDRYADCLAKCEEIINSTYQLTDNYLYNFMADNDVNGAQNEIIFPVVSDGQQTQNYGGTTIIIQGAVGGPEQNGEDLGVNPGGFGGLFRLRPEFSRLFVENPLFEDDDRNAIITEDRDIEIPTVGNNATGYITTKFSNRTSTGEFGSDRTFVDTDVPVFRLADVYLMYAEAHLRGGGGDLATATNYINLLRERAFGDSSGNINSGELTLDFLIDERARELYWESHRRQDLIRFNRYTGNQYIWSYKGGPQQGTSIDNYRTLYPIPTASLATNQNLTQNTGY